MKKINWILIGTILLVGIAFLIKNPRYFWYVADSAVHQECRQMGGTWRIGRTVLEKGYCYQEFPDGGKVCISDQDCEGDCFLPGGLRADETQPKDENGYFIGECLRDTDQLSSSCFRLASMPEPVKEAPLYGTCIDSF